MVRGASLFFCINNKIRTPRAETRFRITFLRGRNSTALELRQSEVLGSRIKRRRREISTQVLCVPFFSVKISLGSGLVSDTSHMEAIADGTLVSGSSLIF
ncbi:hypothetical protein AAC387_Pa03g1221 [Persea americana]